MTHTHAHKEEKGGKKVYYIVILYIHITKNIRLTKTRYFLHVGISN